MLSDGTDSWTLTTVLRGGGTLDVLGVEGVVVCLRGPVCSVCTGAVVTGGQCAVVGAAVLWGPIAQRLLGLVLGARGEWLQFIVFCLNTGVQLVLVLCWGGQGLEAQAAGQRDLPTGALGAQTATHALEKEGGEGPADAHNEHHEGAQLRVGQDCGRHHHGPRHKRGECCHGDG